MEEVKTKKFYQKWWFWLIIAIIVLLIIGSAVGGSSASDDEKKQSDIGDTSSETEETPSKHYVGDTVASGNMYVKINSLTETQSIGYSYKTEHVFLIVNLRVENRGSREAYYDASNFLLKNGNATYEPHSSGISLENGFWLNLTVGAGISKEVNVVYEIPRTYLYDDYYLEIDEGFFSPAEKIYLNK